MIHAVNLHKTYRLPKSELHILRGVSLDVAAGERVAITGRSGSGKSTLLHLLGGLDRPDKFLFAKTANKHRKLQKINLPWMDPPENKNDNELQILTEKKINLQSTLNVLGVDILNATQRELARLRAEKIGFVFQSFHLLNEMDVVENVALPAMALKNSGNRKKQKERASELLRAVGLGDRLKHRPMELSGGEQQRVAIARAMMNSPSLILADEPTGNLDPSTGAQVLDTLFALARNNIIENPALIIVTHSAEIAARCGRVVRLENA